MTDQPAKVFIADACRTPVVPRGGAFSTFEVADLASPVIRALGFADTAELTVVDHVVLGNALYGGGNPARVCALAAGIDISVPGWTVDSQCCAGLDAIAMGAAMIATGQANVVVAGGVESYSRSPVRARRPLTGDDTPLPYARPPFTPWPERDPDMVDAAASLAQDLEYSRHAQEEYAVQSHAKAKQAQGFETGEVIAIAGLDHDAFARDLTRATCQRLPLVAGGKEHGLTSATIAVEADAAAVVLLVSEAVLKKQHTKLRPVEWLAGQSLGGDPVRPGLAPIAAAQALMRSGSVTIDKVSVVEVMEAFAAQAMAFRDALEIPDALINPGGGALSRGHPIGASGAILAVRLFHQLQQCQPGAKGLAAIAAAGGLGSAALFQI